jgi:ribonuclease HIII
VDAESARALLRLGVADSKTIKSDKRIASLSDEIRKCTRGRFSIIPVGPEAYNRLHTKLGNVNRLLAWGHARALENVLEKEPGCPRAVSDQFGSRRSVINALMGKGRKIELQQMPRAEADIAVAAASVLARAEFVRRLELLGKTVGATLPKGAGAKVDAVAETLAARGGEELLRTVAKLHFRTTAKAFAALSGKRSERLDV